jgi:cyclopropane fatty-acyl-phospholipid synthase-like methyltransferase
MEMARRQKNLAERLLPYRSELQECPICNSSRFQPFVVIYGFTYAECRDCGHLFSQSPPNVSRVESLYEGTETETVQHATYVREDLFKERVEQIAKPKVEHVRNIVSPRGGTWVDIGCATGEILIAARQAGWRVRGVEADTAEAEFARRQGLEIIHDYVSTSNAQDYLEGAEIVSSINIVEHLNAPVPWLKGITEALPDGVVVIIEVPRHPSLSSFSNRAFPSLAYRHIFPPEHLHIFTERSLACLLDEAHLRPINLWTFGQDYLELVSSVAASAGLLDGDFLDQVLDIAPTVQEAVDLAGFSDTFFVTAVKV